MVIRMLKDREKLYQIYHTVLTFALSWAVVLIINHNYGLRVSIPYTAFYCMLPSFIIYLADLNRKNAITYLLLISIVPILALIFWITETDPIQWLKNILEWCAVYNGSEELYAASYAHFVILGAALSGALCFYIITRYQVTKIILAVILFAAFIILNISLIEVNKAVVAIGVFYIMTVLVEVNGFIDSKRRGKPEKREGILYLAPICLLLALLSIALPSKPEPLQWTAVKSVYHSVKDRLEIWRTELDYYFGKINSEFFVSLTGYSEDDAELESADNLLKDNKIAMKLSGLEKDKTAYLTGSVSDIYTGRGWEKSRKDYLPDYEDYLLDYMELFYALSRQDMEVLENNRFVGRKVIRIEYNNIKTKTFFYPVKMSFFEIYTRNQKLSTDTPQINFHKAKGKGTSYQAIYFEMNLQGEAFQRMLRASDQFSYEDIHMINRETAEYVQNKLLAQDNIGDLLQGDYYSILGRRSEMIKDRYTGLPEELPQRVYDLAEEITAGYETKYDKLKAIEAYLLANYTYSLEAQKVPEGEDFIDYFLFESKKGYCTSYATAFAILGRCLGIPTRYVEGFLGTFTVRDENFNYLVRNSQAHAWGEAYLEGVGWLPFEATSPFFTNRYTRWAEPVKGDTGYTDPGYSPDFTPGDTAVQQPEEELVILEEDNTEEIVSGIIILAAALGILLMVLVIYYLVIRYRYKRYFNMSDNDQKMYLLFLRILRLLRREGYLLDQQETVLMLAERVKDKFRYDTVSFPDVAQIFMRYRYAQENITKEELQKVEAFHKGLSNKRREEESRLKVWMDEFIFLARQRFSSS